MEDFDEKKEQRQRIPGWILAALITVAFASALFMLILFYLRGQDKSPALSATKPPASTPIPGENGEPAVLNAYLLDVGNGVCFLAVSPEGKTLMVDTGHARDSGTVSKQLDSLGISFIDVLTITSPDMGHAGGIPALAEKYGIGVCYMTEQCYGDPRMEKSLLSLRASGVPIRKVLASFTSMIEWSDPAELRILSPHDVTYENEKDYSLMLRLSYGSTGILLAGDAQKVAERMAVKALPNRLLHSTVLVVGDHGDKDATSDRFLSAVKPQIALISCSDSEPPAASTLEKLFLRCHTVILTNEAGTIHITLDGATAEVLE